MNKKDAEARLLALIAAGEKNVAPTRRVTEYEEVDYSDGLAVKRWVSEADAVVRTILPAGYPLREQWESVVQIAALSTSAQAEVVDAARAMVETALSLVRSGGLGSLLDGVRAETVGELLDQAEALWGAGHLAASTTIAGGALETHLRHLCERAGCLPAKGSISAYEKALAQERKAGREVVSANSGKDVTAWGGRRNEAAHDPATFARTKEEVSLMIEGVRLFVSRYP